MPSGIASAAIVGIASAAIVMRDNILIQMECNVRARFSSEHKGYACMSGSRMVIHTS